MFCQTDNFFQGSNSDPLGDETNKSSRNSVDLQFAGARKNNGPDNEINVLTFLQFIPELQLTLFGTIGTVAITIFTFYPL